MHGLIIVRSLLVRVFLLAHGLICAWRVVDANENQACWVILVGLGFLLIETGIVLCLRQGREYKTVAFCIIFYLTCTTPSLWIIHVETANRKLYRLAENKLHARAILPAQNDSVSSNNSARPHHIVPSATPLVLSIAHIPCHDKAWYYTEEQQWLDAIQEILFVLLSIGRLLISLDYMSIEQSGIIFVITLINSADLLSLSHSLQYHDVILERIWMYIGLVLLTIALFHMALIESDELKDVFNGNASRESRGQRSLFHTRKFNPLLRSLFLHDGLLFLYRTFLVTKTRCGKPSVIFFMSKNLLMIVFHSYRVYHQSKSHDQNNKLLSNYENFSSTSSIQSSHRPFYEDDQQQSSKLERCLIHQTLRRPLSSIRRRLIRTPRALFGSTPPSISYPFARRRNDGGRARTAFALYGLPFRAADLPRLATRSSYSSLVAKAFVH